MIPWIAAHQASLSITNSRSLLKLMSIKLVMPSNHLILCRPLLLLPSIFPSIRAFSSESTYCWRGWRQKTLGPNSHVDAKQRVDPPLVAVGGGAGGAEAGQPPLKAVPGRETQAEGL